MKPTNELRFIEREVPHTFNTVRLERVLQQQWEEVRDFNVHWCTPPNFEWRDVPVEKEEV